MGSSEEGSGKRAYESGSEGATEESIASSPALQHANILVGGSTGSGKTTFTNAILHEIAEQTADRLYIVEDLRELQCAAPNKLQIFVVEPVHGWQRAIVDALRSRPDRIVVGEIRGGPRRSS